MKFQFLKNSWLRNRSDLRTSRLQKDILRPIEYVTFVLIGMVVFQYLVVYNWSPSVSDIVKRIDKSEILDIGDLHLKMSKPQLISENDNGHKSKAYSVDSRADFNERGQISFEQINDEDKYSIFYVFDVKKLQDLQKDLNLLLLPHVGKRNDVAIFADDVFVKSFGASEFAFIDLNIVDVAKASEVVVRYKLFGWHLNWGFNTTGDFQFVNQSTVNQLQRAEDGYYKQRMGVFFKVILALVLVFVMFFIDRSPELKAMTFFVGFDACSIIFGSSRWNFVLGLGELDLLFLDIFCGEMSDLFFLYLVVQVCRVAGDRVNWWLFAGSVYCATIGVLWHFLPGQYDEIWRPYWVTRAITIGVLCLGVSGRVLIFLIKERMALRSLIVSFILVAAVIRLYVPISNISIDFLNWYNRYFGESLVELLSTTLVLFAVSADFRSIRKRLSLAETKNQLGEMITEELEKAGQTQKSQAEVPDLPRGVAVETVFQPLSFVSGDTYFIHYNKEEQKLTTFLHDITGHGVEAALKAYASHTLAHLVWKTSEDNGNVASLAERKTLAKRTGENLFFQFDNLIENLISTKNEPFDVTSFVGVEIDFRFERIMLYRRNYVFPIIIQEEEGTISVSTAVFPNGNVAVRDMNSTGCIVLYSDGLIEKSRHIHSLSQDIQEQFNNETVQIGEYADVIKKTFQKFSKSVQDDDRTLVILTWDKEAMTLDKEVSISGKAS